MEDITLFRVRNRKRFVSIQFFPRQNMDTYVALRAVFAEVLQKPKNVVVSCAGVISLNEEMVLGFEAFNQKLKMTGNSMCIVHCLPALRDYILNLSPKAKILPSLHEAILGFQRSGLAEKMNFIKAFVGATIKTLQVQAQVESTQGKIRYAATHKSLPGAVSGAIIVEGKKIDTYLLIISFPEKTFLGIMSLLLGETITQLTDEIADGATEILNIIFGQAKIEINKTDNTITPSLPILCKGKELDISDPKKKVLADFLKNSKNIIIPFESSVGEFSVMVALPPEGDSA